MQDDQLTLWKREECRVKSEGRESEDRRSVEEYGSSDVTKADCLPRPADWREGGKTPKLYGACTM